jgi:hypothetical protein
LDLRWRECLWCRYECKIVNLVKDEFTRHKLYYWEKQWRSQWNDASDSTGGEKQWKGEENDPTPLGKQCSFTGEETAHCHTSESLPRSIKETWLYLSSKIMKPKYYLSSKIIWEDETLSVYQRQWNQSITGHRSSG